MKIDPGGIINDFIRRKLVQYAIPVYQRNYEWSREQCIQLFEDIVAAHKNDRINRLCPAQNGKQDRSFRHHRWPAATDDHLYPDQGTDRHGGIRA